MVPSVGGTFWAVSRVDDSFGGIGSRRYFLTVSRVGGIFFAEALKPKYGGIFSAVMQYGGKFWRWALFRFSAVTLSNWQ